MTTPTGPMEGFPEPGERIGPYEIVRQLGMGGMGVVFEAVDTVLKRRVALKIISPYLADDPAFRVRFTQEAQAQASLDSPHVVQVFSHGEADGALYIASQLIPDGDLGNMIQASGAPPPRIALDLLAQIATGLSDAHAMGLVHRDIKPANVLLRIRGEEVSAYLADFGIARRTDVDPALSQTLTTQGFVVGTPSYMAPELHTGGAPGAQTDVYSLGCLLWAALVGRSPYSGTTDYQLVAAHVSAPIPQLAAAGPFEREVNRILRTALAKRPADRYPSAAALRDDLRRVLRSFPAPVRVQQGTGLEPPAPTQAPASTHAPAPLYGAPVPSPGPSRSRTTLLVALALVAVLVIVGGAIGAVFALRGDDGGGGGGGGGPSSDTTNENGLTAEEQEAADNIAAAFTEDDDFEPAEAACISRELVERSGIEGLQQKGVIDEDLTFIADDAGGSPDPGFLKDIIAVSVTCVFETVSFGSTPSQS